jgi:outer membrane protein assembly factor BamB
MTNSPPSSARRRSRTPMVLLAACAVAIGYIQFSTSIEGNFKGPLTLLAMLLLLVALGIWTLFFSPRPWRWRLKAVGLGTLGIVAMVLAIAKLTRREGSYTGAGVPRLVWKWTRPRVVPALTPMGANGGETVASTPDDFPQFLGPDRDNRAANVNLSRDWSAHPPVQLWRREVGLGWSGFSTVARRAITMEQRGEQECTVCYDINSGQPIWVHADNAYLHEHEGGDGPRATATISNGRVYTCGGLGNVDCLDAVDGRAIWARTLFKDPEKEHLHYGQTCSPLIVDNMVVVTGGASGPALLAFDKQTGQPLWQTTGDRPSYASPSIVTLAGARQILLVHQHGIQGHSIVDGHTLWEFPWPGFMPKNSQAIAVDSDRVYCSTGYGIGSVLLQLRGGGIEEIWHAAVMKTELSNVVIRDNCVFGLDDGWLTCQDLSTGRKKWRAEKYGHGQILQAGDLFLIQSEDGAVSLMDVTPTGATELGRISALSGNLCWNTPALAGHTLLVRNDREAACYRLP